MKRIFYIALMALSCQATPARADEPVAVPFALLKTQHMVVNVKINGKGPYRLIFDTGAPVTLINNKIAKEAGVIPKDFRPPPFALFGSLGQFTMKTLEVEHLRANNVPTMVMDHPTLTAMANVFGPIEGIVGFGFFARYRMTLDYQAKTLTFVPTGYKPPDLLDKMMKLMLGGRDKESKKVVAPAGLWGFRVGKKGEDKEAGVDVLAVWPTSPAAAAGLEVGDRLLTLDGSWTDSVLDCHTAAARVSPGTAAVLVVRRKGQETTVTVKVQEGV